MNAADVLALAQTAGWPATQRSDALCAVPLDADAPATALLSPDEAGVRVVVEVVNLATAAPHCTEAVNALLRGVEKSVRHIRAVVAEDSAWLEAVLPAPVEAEALADALAALSIAWRLCGREAALLASDEALAADFQFLRAEPAQNRNQTA